MSEQHNKFNYEPKENVNGYVQCSFAEFFRYYKKHSKVESKIQDYTKARKIIEFIFTRIWFYMMTELWLFKLPFKLGIFYISENPNTKGFFRNWKQTNKKGKLVYQFNMETGGIRPFLKWEKSIHVTVNKRMYRFKPFRGEKGSMVGYRGLWDYVKSVYRDPYQKNFRGHIL